MDEFIINNTDELCPIRMTFRTNPKTRYGCCRLFFARLMKILRKRFYVNWCIGKFDLWRRNFLPSGGIDIPICHISTTYRIRCEDLMRYRLLRLWQVSIGMIG